VVDVIFFVFLFLNLDFKYVNMIHSTLSKYKLLTCFQCTSVIYLKWRVRKGVSESIDIFSSS